MTKTFTIAKKTLKNRYIQGPMAGFTDIAMRTLAFKAGASLCYTEMISANALKYNSKDTIEMVKDTQKDIGPLALQLFGYELDHIEIAIHMCEKLGKYDFLDFNFGCPVPKVMKQKAGSHLLIDLDYLYELAKLLVKTSTKPVVVKTRMGFSDPNEIFKIVEVFENAGVSGIAIHGRTKAELYSGKPHYDIIKEVIKTAKVPIFISGNLNLDNTLETLSETKADASMIARASIGNPLIFTNLIKKENNEPLIPLTIEKQIELLKEHVDLIFDKQAPERINSLQLRSIAPSYFSKFPESKEFRSKIVRCLTKEDYLNCIKDYKDGKNLK